MLCRWTTSYRSRLTRASAKREPAARNWWAETLTFTRTGVEVRSEGHGPLGDVDGIAVHHLSLFPETEPIGPPATEPEVLPWQDPASERGRATARRTYLRYLDELRRTLSTTRDVQ